MSFDCQNNRNYPNGWITAVQPSLSHRPTWQTTQRFPNSLKGFRKVFVSDDVCRFSDMMWCMLLCVENSLQSAWFQPSSLSFRTGNMQPIHPPVGSKRPHSAISLQLPSTDPDPSMVLVELIRKDPGFAACRDTITALYARCEDLPGILPAGIVVNTKVMALFELVDTPLFRNRLQVPVLPECMWAHVLFILIYDLGMPLFMGHMLDACHVQVASAEGDVLRTFYQMLEYVSVSQPPGPCDDSCFLPLVDDPDWWRLYTPAERLVYAIVAMDVGWVSKYGYDFCSSPSQSACIAQRTTTHKALGKILQQHPLAPALYAATTQPENLQSVIQHGSVKSLCSSDGGNSLQYLAPAVRDAVGQLYTASPSCLALLNVLLNKGWAQALYLLSHGERDALSMPSRLSSRVPQSAIRDDFLRVLRQGGLNQWAEPLLGDMSLETMLRIFQGNDQSCDRDYFNHHLWVSTEVLCVDFQPMLSITEVKAADFDSGAILGHKSSTFYRCSIPRNAVITAELVHEYLVFMRDQRGAQLSDSVLHSLGAAMTAVLETKVKVEVVIV